MAAPSPLAETSDLELYEKNQSTVSEVHDEPEVADEPDEEISGQDTHPLNGFFTTWEGCSGVYFISPYYDASRPTERFPVKVGMSRHRYEPSGRGKYGGLGRRMDSYLLCYPHGFFVYAVLQCSRQHVYRMEKYFHQYFTGKGFQTTQHHSHREEWFNLTRQDVYSTIKAYTKAYPSDITHYKVYLDTLPLVDSNGRLALHPKKDLSLSEKAQFEEFMSPGGVPTTLPRAGRKKHKPLESVEHEYEQPTVHPFHLEE